jgi:hypothetical protein
MKHKVSLRCTETDKKYKQIGKWVYTAWLRISHNKFAIILQFLGGMNHL